MVWLQVSSAAKLCVILTSQQAMLLWSALGLDPRRHTAPEQA